MMHRTTLVAVAALLGSLLAVEPARAELRPAPAFGPHMVLQSQAEVPVWGVAEAGQEVAVRFAGQAVKAKADGQGHWRAILKPMDASAEGRTLTIAAGDETVELEGVVVGEVWIHVGPGGGDVKIPPPPLPEHLLGKKVVKTEGLFTKHIAEADYPDVRIGMGGGAWTVVQPTSAGGLAAGPFYFARELRRHVDAPIGVLTVPGSGPTFSWTPVATLKADPTLRKTILERYEAYAEAYPDLAEARKAMKKKQQGVRMTRQWVDPSHERFGGPGRTFEQALEPHMPFAARGMIFNGSSSDIWGLPIAQTLYDALPAMIRGWREHRGQPDMPIIIVGNNSEAPRAYTRPLLPAPSNIAQEAQRRAAAQLENVGLAVLSDLYVDVEPAHKNLKRGERTARAARAVAYGHDVVPTGPMFKKAEFKDGKAYVSFDTVDGGLAPGGSLVPKGGSLKGFSIAGEDRVWHWAEARIEGDYVVASNEDVPEPAAVRFAFAEGAVPHLANELGLPAATFRSDDWSLDIPTREPRSTKAPKVDAPPKLDGAIGDDEWPGDPIDSFIVRDTYKPARHATRVWLAYDQDNLYVAAEVETVNSFPIAGVKQDDNRMIVWDDAVEVLIDADHDETYYHRFVLNARGKLLDGIGYNASKQRIDIFNQTLLPNFRWFDESWDAEAKVKTGFGGDQWSFEMAIPWSSLDVEKPGSGAKMGLQVIRTAAKSQYVTKPLSFSNASSVDQRFNALMRNEWSQWTNTGRGSQTGASIAFERHIHRPTRFGTLVLE